MQQLKAARTIICSLATQPATEVIRGELQNFGGEQQNDAKRVGRVAADSAMAAAAATSWRLVRGKLKLGNLAHTLLEPKWQDYMIDMGRAFDPLQRHVGSLDLENVIHLRVCDVPVLRSQIC